MSALRFVALGGLGEVGMNCALLECDGKMLMLDCGVTFPDDDVYGVDTVAPDFDYVAERIDDIAGVLITHGHMDHIGALPVLLTEFDLPIWAPRYACGLIRHQLSEAGIHNAKITEIRAGQRIKIGGFDCEFVHVNHSIPDTLAVAFRTSAGLFVHTADFKLDDAPPFGEPPVDRKRLRELGDEGVRALFSDSTNVLRSGRAGSESQVRDAFLRIVRQARGRVIVTQFSSNIYRVQSLIEAAHHTGRKVVLLGRSLQRNVQVARDAGILKLPSDLLIDAEDSASLPRSEVVIACTGSQGQWRAALNRMANGGIAGLQIEPGDEIVFSARDIPGNEMTIARLQDRIVRIGGTILDVPEAHVSGHAYQDEQSEMIQMLRPQALVPVHGDHRYLVAHAALARDLGVQQTHVLDNGQVLQLDSDGGRVVNKLEARRVAVDHTPFAFFWGPAMKARARMAERGVCLISLVVDEHRGGLRHPPEVQNLGLFDDEFADGMIEEVTALAGKTVGDLRGPQRLDADAIGEAVRVALIRYFRRETGRKPMVIPVVQVV